VTEYHFRFDGPSRERVRVECGSVADARAKAIRHLGAHLIEHPEFAEEGHWRLIVEDDAGRPYFHVIVATVTDRGRKE